MGTSKDRKNLPRHASSGDGLPMDARALTRVLANISDFAYMFDLQGRFRFANKPLLDLWGITLEQAVGKNFVELQYLPELATKLQLQIDRVIQTKARIIDETTYTSPSGVVGYYEYIFSPVLNSDGEVEAVAGCTRDISERKRADERASLILETITDAFFAVDRDWRFSYVNPRGERLLERASADLLGKVMWEEFSGLIGSDFERMYRRVVDEQIASTLTSFYPDHGRWYEVHAYPGPMGGMSVYFRDMSEQHRHSEALKHSEQRLAAIVQTALDCIVGMDSEGRVTEWNPAAELTFGYTRGEAMGQELASLIIPVALRDQHRQGLSRYLITHEGPILGKRLELRAVRKSGDEFPVELTITPVDDGGSPAFTGYLRDITEPKQAEAQRELLLESERAARMEAERAGRMKDEFLATLSHEIRTPLNAILGWSQIMRDSTDPDDLSHGLEVIERNARVQSQIVEDLLDMSGIISGKVRLDAQRLDLASIVKLAVETAKPTADAKGVRISAVIDPLHGVAVSGDANRMQQVLWNLISNAIKFTPKGGRVQVLLERVNSHLEMSVIDSGEGIKPEFLPYVFDRFRQADGSTTRRHGGLGLGLSIVKQLVELHGGAIRVKSAGEGLGSHFAVSLPMIAIHPEEDAKVARHHPRIAHQQTDTSDSCADIADVRVLVIDDEPDARALVKRLLEDCHAIVTATDSVEEVVRLVETRQFDVLISDIGMPGEDGYALIKRVRRLGRKNGGDIPAIALTAYARAADRVKAVAAGFLMHVAKPVESNELIMMVACAAGRTWPR